MTPAKKAFKSILGNQETDNAYKLLYSFTDKLVVFERDLICYLQMLQPFPKQHISDSSKLNKFAYDDFIFDEYGRKISKKVENTEGKGEIARYKQFFLFSKCFQDLYCRYVTRGA